MNRWVTMLSIAACVLATCPACRSHEQAEAPRFDNPIVKQRADPWVYLHTDGYYYMTATVPEYDRLEIRRSKTIEGLGQAEPKVIWRKHAKGPMGAHIWAPELHRIDGTWYIHFAAGGAEDVWRIRMYVLACDADNPMDGEWVEKGQVQTKWDSFSLDATTFEHKGKRYLVWAQHEPGEGPHGTDLYLSEMQNPWTLKGEQVRITRAELPWERRGFNVNEGAAVIKRNGRIFLSYSASATDANYCVGLLTADEDADLLDPASWHKSQSPVFSTYEASMVFGPGHNSFTTTPDGKTDLMVYHARNYREINGDPLRDPNRHTRVQVLRWREDGTPDFGYPLPNARGR